MQEQLPETPAVSEETPAVVEETPVELTEQDIVDIIASSCNAVNAIVCTQECK